MAAPRRLEDTAVSDGDLELVPRPGADDDDRTGGGEAPAAADATAGASPDAAAVAPERLPGLPEILAEQPQTFGFFQAVSLLERMRPERKPVGIFADPLDEAVHFSVPADLAFPASEIGALDAGEGDEPARMRVNFMGLIGPLGVLPYDYTRLVASRLREGDTAPADFLNIFQHRAISLFYRAWRKHRFEVAREAGEEDRLAEHLADVVGLGLGAQTDRLPFPDTALFSRAGLLAPMPRGAAALQQLIEDYFEVPVEIEQFVGGWYRLSSHDRCAVGEEDDPANRLGRGAVAGDEIWDPQGRVRIRLGPLDRAQFDAFLPTGDAHEALRALARFFAHDQYDFELQLVLSKEEVPGFVVGDDAAEQPLGWGTWIRTARFDRDADETTLTL